MGAEQSAAVLRLLGLAKRAGRVELGEDGVSGAALSGKARLVLLAGDAAENSARRVRNWTQDTRAVVLSVPFTKEELGAAFGRGSCAMLAVTESGFALSAAQKLAEAFPGQYEEAVESLRSTDARIRARRGTKKKAKK